VKHRPHIDSSPRNRFLLALFKSQRQLILENLALKQQVAMLRQSVKRPRATPAEKIFWILFSRYVESWRRILFGLVHGRIAN
jgi:hypothetical protein